MCSPAFCLPNAVSISVGANRDTLGLLPRDGGCAALCCDGGGGPVHVCVSVHHRKTRPFRLAFLVQFFSTPRLPFIVELSPARVCLLGRRPLRACEACRPPRCWHLRRVASRILLHRPGKAHRRSRYVLGSPRRRQDGAFNHSHRLAATAAPRAARGNTSAVPPLTP